MTYSCILRDSDNHKMVRVRFEREGESGTDMAEAVLPGGRFEKTEGFTREELLQLSAYLSEQEEEIWARAKEISDPMKWL